MRTVLVTLVVLVITLSPAILKREIAKSESKTKDIEAAMVSIIREFGNEKEIIDAIKPNFEELKRNYDDKKITYCLDKYINAELDFTTPGNRGIGRISEYVPRFGAYFRKALSNMPEADLAKLYSIIQDIMLRGYLVHVLFIEESVREPVISSEKELYEKWIPGIYSQNLPETDENLVRALVICTYSAFETLREFMNIHRMKDQDFFSEDKTDEILFYYAIAGFGLRVVETRGY